MKLTEPVLQLYCVVSNHSLSTDYQWSSVSDGTIGVCGPVLYVQNTGIYRCTMKAMKQPLSRTISSWSSVLRRLDNSASSLLGSEPSRSGMRMMQ